MRVADLSKRVVSGGGLLLLLLAPALVGTSWAQGRRCTDLHKQSERALVRIACGRAA